MDWMYTYPSSQVHTPLIGVIWVGIHEVQFVNKVHDLQVIGHAEQIPEFS